MILALHILFLSYTTYKVAFLERKGFRYRPFYSAIAYAWAGGSAVLVAAMITHWPKAIDQTNALTCLIAGASAGLAWWCGGNVACLVRKIKVI